MDNVVIDSYRLVDAYDSDIVARRDPTLYLLGGLRYIPHNDTTSHVITSPPPKKKKKKFEVEG